MMCFNRRQNQETGHDRSGNIQLHQRNMQTSQENRRCHNIEICTRYINLWIIFWFAPKNMYLFSTFIETDIKELTTSVYAIVLGLPLPFIGVDGTSACDKMFLEDGITKVECPLKAGQNYVYKNSFPVLELYPKLTLVVHWALTTKNNKDAVCFELPAKIL